VYLAEHMSMRRRVAIKVLPISKADNPSALGRFYREARAAGGLDHPNLVKAHDIDEENGLHYLVMEYVDGSSLQEIIARVGPMSPERAAHYISQAALGLQAAHVGGLIHRDIKPANILLDRNGVIRVLDLGLARFYSDDEDQLTLKYDEKNVLGTADYVAPEQALNSHEVDIRADIYSLGATCYFLLSGQPPFPGGKAAQKLIWHQTRMPKPLCDVRADVPIELSAVVQKMLAKDPRQRQQTPAEVAEALAPWTAATIPPPAPGEMPHLSPAVRGQTAEGDPVGPQTPAPRPGPWARAVTASTPVPPMPGPPRMAVPPTQKLAAAKQAAPRPAPPAQSAPAAPRAAPPPRREDDFPPIAAPTRPRPGPLQKKSEVEPDSWEFEAEADALPPPPQIPVRTAPGKVVWIVLLVVASALLGLGAQAGFQHLRRTATTTSVNAPQLGQQGESRP
jgi:serine/threonine protein kinase